MDFQAARYAGLGVRRNARLPPGLVDRFCSLDGSAFRAFRTAADRLDLSGRAAHAVLRLSRTIADLDGRDAIVADDVLEAVQHRRYGDDPFDVLVEEP